MTEEAKLKQPQSHRDLDFGNKLYHVSGDAGMRVEIKEVTVDAMIAGCIEERGDNEKLPNLYYINKLFFRKEDALEKAREILTADDLPF